VLAKATLFLLVTVLAVPVFADTPVPTVPPYVQDALATAAANTNELPSDISAPSGQAVVPSSDAAPLFAYIKWLFSLNTAQELLGRKMAPVAINLFIVMVIVITLTGVYLAINLITLLIRFAVWVLTIVIKIIDLIPFI
jgi:hypothetical protein